MSITTYVVEQGLRLEIDPQLRKFSSKAVHHDSVLNGRTNETESIRDEGLLFHVRMRLDALID